MNGLSGCNMLITYAQSRWQGKLPAAPPLGVSQRNWVIFRAHVDERISMCALGREHGLSRARMSAIISRIDQVLRYGEINVAA